MNTTLRRHLVAVMSAVLLFGVLGVASPRPAVAHHDPDAGCLALGGDRGRRRVRGVSQRVTRPRTVHPGPHPARDEHRSHRCVGCGHHHQRQRRAGPRPAARRRRRDRGRRRQRGHPQHRRQRHHHQRVGRRLAGRRLTHLGRQQQSGRHRRRHHHRCRRRHDHVRHPRHRQLPHLQRSEPHHLSVLRVQHPERVPGSLAGRGHLGPPLRRLELRGRRQHHPHASASTACRPPAR